MSLHVKLFDIDYPLTFEESKLRQIKAHALIYLRLIKKVLFTDLTPNVVLMLFTSFSLCQHVLHCIGESKSHLLIMCVSMES